MNAIKHIRSLKKKEHMNISEEMQKLSIKFIITLSILEVGEHFSNLIKSACIKPKAITIMNVEMLDLFYLKHSKTRIVCSLASNSQCNGSL
jgi:hypothetical protein